MARTKQSANKVTWGKAPRVTLQASQKKKGKALTASSRPTPKQKPIINNFCVIKCLVIPEGAQDKLEQGDVTFKCVTYHWKENQANPQPYFEPLSLPNPPLSWVPASMLPLPKWPPSPLPLSTSTWTT
ncbi:hypothetical protein EDD17DRAFT_1508741 [Pisolithus thermaeus]|nr:hypothetical protein EDD17DRAFT_1508741 [Pisolithus thermaeus]